MALAFLNKCAHMHAGHPNRCFWVWATASFVIVSGAMVRLEMNHEAAVVRDMAAAERDNNLARELQDLRTLLQKHIDDTK